MTETKQKQLKRLFFNYAMKCFQTVVKHEGAEEGKDELKQLYDEYQSKLFKLLKI